MSKRTLLVSQRNLVFECIRNYGFDPTRFEWYDQEITGRYRTLNRVCPAIRYKGSEFYFCFDAQGDDLACFFSPGMQSSRQQVGVADWDEQFYYFQLWLQYLRRETEQPDLWEQFAENGLAAGLEGGVDEDNRVFTRSEIKSIEKSITEIRKYLLKNGAETQTQVMLANSRLDFLIEESKKRGRRDWFFLAVGLLLSTCTELAMDPEKLRIVFGMLKIGISGAVHLLGLP